MTWDTISIRHPPSNDRAPPPSRMGSENYRIISKLHQFQKLYNLRYFQTLFEISQPNMAIRWSVFQCSLLCAYTKSSNKQTALSVLRAIWVPLISSWPRPCKPGRPTIWWNSAIWRLARWIWRDLALRREAGDSKKPRQTFFECHACSARLEECIKHVFRFLKMINIRSSGKITTHRAHSRKSADESAAENR